jgi:ketosteroid isomerase-like protein
VNTAPNPEIPDFLIELEDAFNKAMVSNDVEQISRVITDDWILVTPEAGPVSRARILGVIESGLLTHSSMTKVATHSCVVGDVAWVTGRGGNTGTFNGAQIEADEYITDIYRRVNGEWRCMLTHLTPARDGQRMAANSTLQPTPTRAT